MSKASTNERRATQLGMSFGAACGQLRKRLLFVYVQKCGDDTCYVCGKPIESVDDLSIEHKQRWLDVSAELFWDLDNIAFSHLRCNRPHRTGRAESPEGMAWCHQCKKHKPIDQFAGRKRRWNGIDHICTPCNSERIRKWKAN